MVGDIAAAEDLVQDTFEKWLQTEHDKVREVKAYLSRILINNAIHKLKKLGRERELYKGLWMPQPWLSEQNLQEEHTLEYAVLLLLENLNPYERAVFVLKEVFSYSHQEIATALDITPDNCRQLLHRAKEKVRSPIKQQEAGLKKQQELLEAFLQAVYHKKFDKLKEIFLNDIVMYQDGGGKMAAALKPIAGIEKTIKFMAKVIELDPDGTFDVRMVSVNGEPGVLVFRNGIPDSIVSIEMQEDKISKLFIIRNPDKMPQEPVVFTGEMGT
jgi:RNA polymerase sigma-70 factor (ECF subfamily)